MNLRRSATLAVAILLAATTTRAQWAHVSDQEPVSVRDLVAGEHAGVYDESFSQSYDGSSCDSCGAAGGCDSCSNGCGSKCYCEARVGFLYMRREQFHNTSLIQIFNTSAQEYVEVLNVEDLDFEFEMGADVGLIFHLDCHNALEVRYLWLDDFDSEASLVNNDSSPTIRYGTNPVSQYVATGLPTRFDIHYRSELQTGEINVRRYPCDWLALMCGFRYVELDEKLRISELDSSISSPESTTWSTQNDMFGLQLGTEVVLVRPSDNLRLDGLLKGGVYYNSAESTVIDQLAVGSGRNENDDVAFLCEAGLYGTYHLTCHCAIRLGYQVMWLGEVAEASEQVPSTGNVLLDTIATSTDTDGNILYHGANLTLIGTY